MRWIVIAALAAGVVVLFLIHSIDPLKYSDLIRLGQSTVLAGSTNATTLDFQSLGILAKRLTQLIVSIVLLAASLFVILAQRYSPTERHWAYGTIGTLVGFWLKTN